MWQRNNGQAEDDLQFRFTAYLVSAVKRRRKDYLIQLYKRNSIESAVEAVYESEPSSEEVVLDRLPLMDVIENGVLLEALQKLNERERQIFRKRSIASTCSSTPFSAIIVSHYTESKKLSTQLF